ncbi:MAG: riboflavin synthase [Vicinamibacterales bacterium]|nr:riboflavin synthase [Vicinamibacterales bacterium]
MFTGLIEALGTLVEVKPAAGGFRVRIETSLAPELAVGESLAVNGVCLTATLIDDGEVHAEVGPETARVTTLGGLQRGQPVNLERAMRFDGRLGGHFVQGHVDGVGVVDEVRPESDSRWLTLSFPPALAPYFIRKGSVAVDGVSLTVAGLGEKQFDVQVIPHTWAHTTLKTLRAGDRVNLECDMLGKYVIRAAGLAGLGEGRRQDPS